MKIARVTTQNFAGVPDGTYSFLAPNGTTPNELTLIAGVRGSGKTRLLEAVLTLKELVGSYGAPTPTKALVQPGFASGKLSGTFLLSDEEKAVAELSSKEFSVEFGLGENTERAKFEPAVRDLFARFDHDHAHGKMEYFPAWRTLPRFGEPTVPAQEKILRTSMQPTKYAGVIPSLVALSLADGARALEETSARGLLLKFDSPDSLGFYRGSLAKVLPELRLRGAQPDPSGAPSLVFERADGSTVDARNLSEAQKQAFLIVATILRLGISHSIVLLDGPELHVHVADQARFLAAIMGVGNDNQWIVATGSSEILKGARREQMIALAAPRDASR